MTISSKLATSRDLSLHFVFETYGVAIKIESNDPELLEKARGIAKKSFIERLEFIEDNISLGYTFGLKANGGIYELFENGVYRSGTENEFVFLKFFTSYLRVIVAERAKPWVFLHAGAVGRNGRTAIFPGDSFSGKTTLVAELLKRGADYYSDEYAVIGEDGLIHAFPRPLAIRADGDRGTVCETKPQEFGADDLAKPAVLGLVLLTKYVPGSLWEPERLTLGHGIMEIVPHTISIRFNTAGGLNILNKALENAIILKGARGNAAHAADTLLSMMDDNSNWS